MNRRLFATPDQLQDRFAVQGIRLTRTESKLAWAMMNTGRIMTRYELELVLWGVSIGNKTIATYIHRLRQKVGIDRIGTIKQRGYLWMR